MKLETILKELRECKDNPQMINNLELKLIESIKKETIKHSGGSVKRYNAAQKILNCKENKSRPLLQTAKTENNAQRFTNSHIAFILKGDSIIKGLRETDKEATYPSFDNLIPKNTSQVVYTKNEILQAIKTSKTMIALQPENDITIYLNKTYVLYVIDILQPEDSIVFNYSSAIRPLLIENRNGDQCILMPIKKEHLEDHELNEIEILKAV
jgi:hypothetical protein